MNYSHLYYYSYSPLTTSNTSALLYTKNSIDEYNVTINLTLIIDYNNSIITNELSDVVIHSRSVYPINSKVCRNNALGYWNGSIMECFYHFNTYKICLVIDNDFNIVNWYKSGCDNEGYIKQSPVSWTNDSEFWNFSYNVEIELRNQFDPFVFASYNQLVKLSSSSQEYQIIGMTIFTVASAALIAATIGFFKQKRNKTMLYNIDSFPNVI